MEIRKILVGTDYSEQAETAVAQAANLARKLDAELILLHAGTVPEYRDDVPESMRGAAERFEQLLRDQLSENRDKLEQERARFASGGIKASHMIIDGFPDTGIVEAAEELGADLIVVGTHGRTGFKRFLMGSVAERVVRLSDCSVLVARPQTAGTGGFSRILVPTDFSATAERALTTARLVAKKGATIEVFHCWQLPGPVTGYWGPIAATGAVLDPLRNDLREAVEAQGKDLMSRHSGAEAAVAFDHAEDSAIHGIQRRLEDGKYDLVVMGSHGRRGLRRWMLGSVAEATVRYAPCSTMVIHPETKEGAA